MNKEKLTKVINQIKKYDLAESFNDTDKFKDWVVKLNNTQLNNFLSLDINKNDVKNIKHLLINNDLLNAQDYKQRVQAISNLKNGKWDSFHYFHRHIFLKSKHFYKDLEMLSHADKDHFTHGLYVLTKDEFIDSPYHEEDLKLIIEAKDTNKEKEQHSLVSEALSMVASNIESIKSPYHREDMNIIATSGSSSLQTNHTYPKSGLNNLAVNKVSLKDKYHLENMQILASNPVGSEFLYIIMTNPALVKDRYYRQEVKALLNAKSKLTARALYYYIANPSKKFDYDSLHKDYKYSEEDAPFQYVEYVSGKCDPDYISNLNLINQTDDKFVMHIVSLLMNPTFISSPYKKFDLELLQLVTYKPIFMSLYLLMSDENSQRSIHHKKDAVIISQTADDVVRDLLLAKATDENSLKSNNHEYDMEYIAKLNLDLISEDIYYEMYYYLFDEDGINDSRHQEKLEKLLQGILVERNIKVSSYLDTLETQLENDELVNLLSNSNSKIPNILKLVKKYFQK